VVLHTIHGLLFHDAMSFSKQMLYWMPEKLTATFAHRLLSQSREDVDRAIAAHLCRPEKITWIGNGIDVRRFSRTCVDGGARHEFGLKPTDFVVGCVGRLVREKGFEELLGAADLLLPRYPDLRFLIIGFEEHRHSKAIPCSRFDALVRRGKVVLAGSRTDMPRCYAAMELLVHPSHREGVPRTCLEAAAMEVPVIASDIRGCREAVMPGVTGELVPVRDPRALAHAIESMMQNPALCRARGVAGRQFVLTNFDARLVLNRLAEVYADILRQLRGTASFAIADRGIADSV
jgi:glycosyltransferase involved in cell wall biosynthesis